MWKLSWDQNAALVNPTEDSTERQELAQSVADEKAAMDAKIAALQTSNKKDEGFVSLRNRK